jgi:predicted TPR repeat methyltransferase
MPAYERFAPFYDQVMDDPFLRASRVLEAIDHHHPDAASLLELGCGTGAILAHLGSVPSLTGLDASPAMLAIAATKVPTAHLLEGDMASFALGRTFDVVISVFDSVNHLLTFDAWLSMFEAVHRHLADDGLFVFDVNTTGELRRLGDDPPWVFDFDGGVAVIDVTVADGGAAPGAEVISAWDVRIFEDRGGDRFVLHREEIGELGVSLGRITAALQPHFTLLEATSDTGGAASDDAIKAHFVLRRR